jgi:hypothetical protein
MADRHRIRSGQLGNISTDVVVEAQHASRRQHQHRRRDEGLRDRDDVEPRLRTDRDPGLEAGQPDVPLRDDLAVADHRHRDARLVGTLLGQALDEGPHAIVGGLRHRPKGAPDRRAESSAGLDPHRGLW